MTELLEHNSPAAMEEAVAERLRAALEAAIADRGRALFVATGGATAPRIYDRLAQAPISWADVRVILSDERCVPEINSASNARLVRERLMVGPAALARFLPFEGAEEGAIAAARFSRFLSPLSRPGGGGAIPDAVLLGMGEDLHIASIFPAGEGMDHARSAEAAIAVATTPNPLPETAPYPRLTLSLPFLATARAIHVVFSGAAKRAAFERATPEAPISALLAAAPGRVTLHWSS